jgi:ABC-type multidrug transport system fused ATPase/permease subunit
VTVAPPASTSRWVLRLLGPHRAWIGGLALLSAVEVGLRVLSPWPFKLVIDLVLGSQPTPVWAVSIMTVLRPALGAIPNEHERLLVAIVVSGFLIQLTHQLVMMLHTRLQSATGRHMVGGLREQLFSHLQALHLADHNAIPRGDCVYRLSSDTACLEHLVLHGVFPIVFSAVTLVAMFVVLVRVDATLAVVSLAVAPVMYAWLRLHTRRMQPVARRGKEIDAAFVQYTQEVISSVVLVKTHARETFEEQRFATASNRALDLRLQSAGHESVFAVVMGALTILGSSSVVLVGSLAVLHGRLPLGTLLLVLSYLTFVYGPLSGIANTTSGLQQAIASAGRVREIFEILPEPVTAPGALKPAHLRGSVQFDRVSFSYRRGGRVLDGVTFAAAPGEMIALVGASGAGKTTAVSLIARLYDAASGSVLIDGLDVKRYDLRTLRRHVAVVTQDATILSGTVRENLRYGRLDATDTEIEAAARAAHAHDFITALPEGYDTRLGDAAMALSGGQRQRLSIARAFVKDAPILILDEPTSALDTISERLVFDGLRSLQEGRTTFVIAHRLSTVRAADRILVLDHGHIVAQGRHEALVLQSPLYAKLAEQLSAPPQRQRTA